MCQEPCNGDYNEVVYIDDTLVAEESTPSPVGLHWRSLGSSGALSLNNRGDHVLKGSVWGDFAVNSLISRNGAKFIQKGDSLPAIAPYQFDLFTGDLEIADTGRVLWAGRWQDSGGIYHYAIFLDDRLLVQDGVTTIGGVVVANVGNSHLEFHISDNGRWVVFEAVLADGTSGAFRIDLFGEYDSYCFGDGSGTPCGCGNANDESVPGSGCANGVFASGAKLVGHGSASLSADTLVLSCTGLEPGNSGLYFQADNDLSPGSVWGDGLRCAGGSLRRLGVRFSDAAGASDTSGYPDPISTKAGNIAPGDTKHYQCWYRNPNGSPCGADFNASNGLVVTWAP